MGSLLFPVSLYGICREGLCISCLTGSGRAQRLRLKLIHFASIDKGHMLL